MAKLAAKLGSQSTIKMEKGYYVTIETARQKAEQSRNPQ